MSRIYIYEASSNKKFALKDGKYLPIHVLLYLFNVYIITFPILSRDFPIINILIFLKSSKEREITEFRKKKRRRSNNLFILHSFT